MELTPYQGVQPSLNDPASRQGCTTLDASCTRLAATSRNQSLEMELVTAEGDRVTLSLESQSRSLAVSYAEMHAGPDEVSLEKGKFFASEQERSMTMTVEGDLNEDEKRDLRRVLKTLKKMMANFVQNRLKPMMAKARQLDHLETVAGLEVEMSYSRQVLVAEQTQINTTYNQQGAVEQTGSQDQPQTDQTPLAEENWPVLENEADALTDAMAEQMKQVQAFIEGMQNNIREMFDDFRAQAEAWNPARSSAPDLIGRMHENLMAKVLAHKVAPQQNGGYKGLAL